MRSIQHTLHTMQDRNRRRRARLPWAELEAEAARQGCSPVDIFFDRAGRPVPGLPALRNAPAAASPDRQQIRTPTQRQPTFETRSRRT